MSDQRIHIAHVLYSFSVGGLENVVVQLINNLPADRFRHTVIALTDIDEGFASSIQSKGVTLKALKKIPGQPFRFYPKMYRLLKELKPDVFHSCNIAALEFSPVAALAGVRLRVHAEHGWDVADPEGKNRKYQILRKIYQLFVHRFVVVSEQLKSYLEDTIGISKERISLITNGVDTALFRPSGARELPPSDFPFDKQENLIFGSVGRLEPIKNPLLLINAFIELLNRKPELHNKIRLAIIGDGSLRTEIQSQVKISGLENHIWLAGVRSDISDLLRALDIFILPSLSEGTSCTLQEAMATAVPIIATNVGGNPNVLGGGEYGQLVPSDDVSVMSDAMESALTKLSSQNLSARSHIEKNYSLNKVISQYDELFTSTAPVGWR